MCKEADEEPAAGAGEQKKVKIPKGLPEPGKPTHPPKDAMIPPVHSTALANQKATIAIADTFTDKDLSSISDA